MRLFLQDLASLRWERSNVEETGPAQTIVYRLICNVHMNILQLPAAFILFKDWPGSKRELMKALQWRLLLSRLYEAIALTMLASNTNEWLWLKLYFDKNFSCRRLQIRAESSVNTNLPVGAFGIGQRLTGQPEVAFLKSKAGQQLCSLCLEFVQVALFDCYRRLNHGPLGKLRHYGRRCGQNKRLVFCV